MRSIGKIVAPVRREAAWFGSQAVYHWEKILHWGNVLHEGGQSFSFKSCSFESSRTSDA
jgi:hypothetical protein